MRAHATLNSLLAVLLTLAAVLRAPPATSTAQLQTGFAKIEIADRDDISRQDADNRASVDAYLQNIAGMEQLTRLNTNLALLKKHLAQNEAAGTPILEAEVRGLRIGNFTLVTFPGELTVQIGLNIKQAVKDPHAFVAGDTNGYLYYTPTAEQRRNSGFAQEDCDSLVAPHGQGIFEAKAIEVLSSLK